MNVSGWLANLLGPLDLFINGVAASVPRRTTFNFVGITPTDDPDNERTDIAVDAATTSAAGSMSASDKTKLDGLQKQGSSQAISALAIDWSLASVFTKTLGAGGNTFTFSNALDGMVIVVILTGASSTVTWPTVKWAGGTPPTQTTSGTDVYTFVKAGSTIYGSAVQDMS